MFFFDWSYNKDLILVFFYKIVLNIFRMIIVVFVVSVVVIVIDGWLFLKENVSKIMILK